MSAQVTTVKEWAQLVSTSDISTPPLPIRGGRFTIGRALGCNLSLSDNKLISGQHCVITRSNDGKVELRDTSTNGTLIKSSVGKVKVTKGMNHKLEHGDEIFLVFTKEDNSKNVAYMFQDLSQLLDETLVNEDREDDDEECTQEYDSKDKESDARPADTTCTTKRPVSQVDSVEDDATQAKRHQADISQITPSDQSGQPQQHPRGDVTTTVNWSDTACLPTVPSLTAHDIPTAIQEAACPPGIGTAIDTTAAAVDPPVAVTSRTSTSAAGDAENAAGEGLADHLICSICQDIFHDCISLQPCLHSFCAACYSSWMDVSKECPSCRNEVERISRNFIVNSLVEAFCKEHPDRKRCDEEIADMNAKNKITRDMMDLSKKRQNRNRCWTPSDDDDDDDDDDEYEVDSPEIACNCNPGRAPFIFGQPSMTFGARQIRNFNLIPPASTCIQCPGYIGPGLDAGITLQPHRAGTSADANSKPCTATAPSQSPTSTTTTESSTAATSTTISDQPSTSSTSTSAPTPAGRNCRGYKLSNTTEAIPMPIVPQYVCPPGSNHLMCGCCYRQMPDRRQAYYANPQLVPPQKCDVCGNFFCHQYWGCIKLDCNGCLNKFQDLHFGKKCLDHLILKNSYESQIFKDYLKRKQLTWKDVLGTCMTKLDSGEYICQDGAINRITSANILCYHCGLKNFQELAYRYRRDLPRGDLPPQIAARPDCHWGKKCRTQICKAHHAKNFNHICEQTRF